MNIIADKRAPQTAPLVNVRLFLELVMRVKDVPPHMPNWGVFYGLSGLGKTTASAAAALQTHSVYLECGSTWTTGTLVDNLCVELNMGAVKGPVAKRVSEIIRLLADDPIPLIFDEADHLVKKSMVDVIREIADKSKAPVILIGEQHLPEKLMAFERAHNRVLDWVEAQTCTMVDMRELVKLYAKGISIGDDLLAKTLTDTGGSARRIVINLERIREFSKVRGLDRIDLTRFQAELELYRGVPQRARKTAKAGAGAA